MAQTIQTFLRFPKDKSSIFLSTGTSNILQSQAASSVQSFFLDRAAKSMTSLTFILG
ncbi:MULTISPECIES: hypothetical protein [Streptococcaceae]|uniref:hypothetical protein n=1 Tax=Streptococcaceae TaxID=1300 RepID=UPI00028307EE|nr:hypothetical protein A0G_0077 [Streptococcus iniae 9117]